MEHKILVSTEKLNDTVTHLAEQVNTAYANAENVMALIILEGARYFAKDLIEQLIFPIEIEYLKASSYLGTTQSCGTVSIETTEELQQKIQARSGVKGFSPYSPC